MTMQPHLRLAWILAGVGVVFRLTQYFSNRSLWNDEATLAINVIDKPWSGLYQPLSFNQGAPVGFLFVEKGASAILGQGEYALRLFPLLCGIAAIVLFVRIAATVLPREVVPVAVLLFVSADGLIYYSSEVKQYSTDVAATLALVALGLALRDAPAAAVRVLIAVGGAAVVWFSHPAAFTMAAVAVTLVVADAWRRDWPRLRLLTPVLGSWLLSLAGALLVARHTLGPYQASLKAETGQALYPTGIGWLRSPVSDLAGQASLLPGGRWHFLLYVAALLGLVGAALLVVRRLDVAGLIVLPFLVAFVAGAMHEYPLRGRTILFLLPLVLILVARGVFDFASLRPQSRRLILLPLAALVCVPPALAATKHIVSPRKHEEMRPVLSYLDGHWQSGDALYVHSDAQYALRYYVECGCLGGPRQAVFWRTTGVFGLQEFAPALESRPPDLYIGTWADSNISGYLRQFGPLWGRKRVWLLISHPRSDAEQAFLHRQLVGTLGCVGRRLDSFERTKAAVYLFDFEANVSASRRRACARRLTG